MARDAAHADNTRKARHLLAPRNPRPNQAMRLASSVSSAASPEVDLRSVDYDRTHDDDVFLASTVKSPPSFGNMVKPRRGSSTATTTSSRHNSAGAVMFDHYDPMCGGGGRLDEAVLISDGELASTGGGRITYGTDNETDGCAGGNDLVDDVLPDLPPFHEVSHIDLGKPLHESSPLRFPTG